MCMCMLDHIWRSEDNFPEFVQVLRLGNKPTPLPTEPSHGPNFHLIFSFTEIEERPTSGRSREKGIGGRDGLRAHPVSHSDEQKAHRAGRMAEKPKEHTACSSVKWVAAPASGDHCRGVLESPTRGTTAIGSSEPGLISSSAILWGGSWGGTGSLSAQVLGGLYCLADFSPLASVVNPFSISPSDHLL